MRITIDALGIGRLGGGRSYILPLLKCMAEELQGAQFDIWVDAFQDELGEHQNLRQHVLPVGNRFLARIALQAIAPFWARRHKSELTHFMKNLTTRGVTRRCVVTIYDLHPLINPETYPASDAAYWRHFQPHALKRVDRIIAISQQTSQDLINWYGVDRDKIEVVYPGIDPGFRPRTQVEIADVLAKYGITLPYTLHVGAVSPKKNLAALVRAFAIVRAHGYAGSLVLIGPVYEKLASVPLEQLAADSGISDALIITGKVPDADLKGLMAGAELFVFPSQYEGFGLAVVEAMACGVPVLAARAGAIAEVIGGAAPVLEIGDNPIELARHIGELLSNPSRRAAVARACLLRAADFGLDRATRRTIAVYENCLGVARQSES